jgi:hypothetical protein
LSLPRNEDIGKFENDYRLILFGRNNIKMEKGKEGENVK